MAVYFVYHPITGVTLVDTLKNENRSIGGNPNLPQYITLPISRYMLHNPDTLRGCPGDSLTLGHTGYPRLGVTWQMPDGTFALNQHTTRIQVLDTPTYYVAHLTWPSCEATLVRHDTTWVLPAGTTPPTLPQLSDTTVCPGTTLLLGYDTPHPDTRYAWQPAIGLACPTCPQTQAQPPATTTFTLTAEHSCRTQTREVTITVQDCPGPDLFIPNVITPNGDGANDELRPLGIPEYSLQVFDRWGTRVAALASQPWRPAPGLPAGVYYYVLELPSGESRTGSVAVFW
jgi:hypothetical protein